VSTKATTDATAPHFVSDERERKEEGTLRCTKEERKKKMFAAN
jgi:hypothetical protein